MSLLVHVGYHKTATTWLQQTVFGEPPFRSLASRGRILDDWVKPSPLAFDPHVVAESYAESIRGAIDAGSVPVLSHERLSGYPASGGYDSKEIADRIAAAFPAARILIVIREQESLLRSWYEQYVRDGGVLDPEAFLHPPRQWLVRVPQFAFEFYEFHRLIAYYHERFSPGRVLVLPYERLREDPRDFLSRVRTFVDAGEATEAAGAGGRENVGVGPVWITVTRWANRLFSRNQLNPNPVVSSSRLHESGVRVARLANRLAPDAVQERRERSLRETIRNAVGDRYRESNRITARLIGHDLASLGYRC